MCYAQRHIQEKKKVLQGARKNTACDRDKTLVMMTRHIRQKNTLFRSNIFYLGSVTGNYTLHTRDSGQ